MKTVCVLLLACLAYVAARADLDPDPDLLGIHFDSQGNRNCGTFTPFVPFSAYVVLCNATAPPAGYEFTWTLVAGTDPVLVSRRRCRQGASMPTRPSTAGPSACLRL